MNRYTYYPPVENKISKLNKALWAAVGTVLIFAAIGAMCAF
jgi:hypothetical protein